MEARELPKEKDRNTSILDKITAGKRPVLPFEVGIMAQKIQGLQAEQSELSRLLGEAMEQSSETWHDNAPAEAINSASHTVVSQAMQVLRTRDNAELYSYPDRSHKVATLGSVVMIAYGADPEVESLILTGAVREMDDDHAQLLPDNTQCVTLQSPLGSALIGAQEGDAVSYTVGEKSIQVNVLGVAQFHP